MSNNGGLRKVVLWGTVLSITFMAGAFSTDVKKTIIKKYYQHDYARMVFRCDHAMREHYIAKQYVAENPSEKNTTILIQTEIALVDCQDYDILRKKLISYGLQDADLAELELLAVEEKSKDLGKVVEIHEIRYE